MSVQDLDGNEFFIELSPTYIDSAKDVDIAILKTQPTNHPYLTFRTDRLLEGQNVVTIGNPQGLTGTVSTGIVSAIREGGNIIQFTAPISNGSSGGPVLDDDGNVIGMVDSILGSDGKQIVENLNFAHGVALMRAAVANQSTIEPQSPHREFTGPSQPNTGLPIPVSLGTTRYEGKLSFTNMPYN